MNKRAIIYARVSTDEQAEQGYGLLYQIERCKERASLRGYTLVHEPVTDEVLPLSMVDNSSARTRSTAQNSANRVHWCLPPLHQPTLSAGQCAVLCITKP